MPQNDPRHHLRFMQGNTLLDGHPIPTKKAVITFNHNGSPSAHLVIADVDISIHAEYISFCRLNGELQSIENTVRFLLDKDPSIKPGDVFSAQRLGKQKLEDYTENELAEALARKVKERSDSGIRFKSVEYVFLPEWYDFVKVGNQFSVTVQLVPENPNPNQLFIDAFAMKQDFIHANAQAHGWWDNFADADSEVQRTLIVEKVALTITELAEAIEALRKNNPRDEHLSQYTNFEVEIADAVIRLMDMAGALDIPLGQVITDKHAYNLNRPKRHGKAF